MELKCRRGSFAAISALRAAALRRLRSETRLRAQCGRRVTLPMAARRRKVHSPPFPPGGENCVRSLAPPLPGKPASLGFAGNNEGLGKTPPDLLTTGGPRASPTQSQKIFLRIVGEGLKVNCPEGAREATPGCAPPPNREGSCRGDPCGRPEHGPASVRPLRKKEQLADIP